jgi:hypothetical protein
MRKLLFLLVLVGSFLAGSPYAAADMPQFPSSDTTFRLGIEAKVCTIDTVEDGGGEMVQATDSEECERMLPNLLTFPAGRNSGPLAARPVRSL